MIRTFGAMVMACVAVAAMPIAARIAAVQKNHGLQRRTAVSADAPTTMEVGGT